MSREKRILELQTEYAKGGEVSPLGESLAIGDGAVALMRLIMTTPPQEVDSRGRVIGDSSILPSPPYEGYVNPLFADFFGELLDSFDPITEHARPLPPAKRDDYEIALAIETGLMEWLEELKATR